MWNEPGYPVRQIDIASYTRVLHSGQSDYAVKMVQHILNRGGPASPDKDADHGDTHDAALCRHALDRFIRLATGAVRNQRAAVGMSYQDGPAGRFDRVQGGAVAAMRNVHGHADLVHALDDGRAVFAQTAICRVGRSSADPVAAIGELRDALAQTVEAIHILDRSKMFGVLLADQDANRAERSWPVRNRRRLPHAGTGAHAP